MPLTSIGLLFCGVFRSPLTTVRAGQPALPCRPCAVELDPFPSQPPPAYQASTRANQQKESGNMALVDGKSSDVFVASPCPLRSLSTQSPVQQTA